MNIRFTQTGLNNEGFYGFTDNPKVSEESVTVSARGTIGFVCLRHIPYVPIVRLVTLIPKTNYFCKIPLFVVKTASLPEQEQHNNNSQYLIFKRQKYLFPRKSIVTLFTATIEPIFEKIWANQNENEKTILFNA